jgi:hypothetical protein
VPAIALPYGGPPLERRAAEWQASFVRILLLAAAAAGLVAVDKTTLDEARVSPTALAAVRAIVVEAPTVALATRPVRTDPIYRDEDWQLRPGDLEQLQKIFREEFGEKLVERGIEIVETSGPGVARLTPALVDVRLTAPLHEDATVRKTFVKSIGDLTLEATVRDSTSNEVVATIRDARRNVPISAAGDRGIRFTSTLYWSEVRHVFRSWAGATADLFPERRKSSPPGLTPDPLSGFSSPPGLTPDLLRGWGS